MPAMRRGQRKRFCGDRCRLAFHTVARQYTEAQIAAGFRTPADLRAWSTAEKPSTASSVPKPRSCARLHLRPLPDAQEAA